MIYLDISKLNITDEWKEEARNITDKLINAPERDRPALIERNSRIWKALKSELERLSHRKCWYCETRYKRADFHVDHHRPKNRVRSEEGGIELGYWWLAFEYTNFRLACNYCNCPHIGPDGITRGKSDRFPLVPGCIRASSPQSNLNDEIPILLDPTNTIDPSLLWFMEDGKAYPRYIHDCLPNLRARKSIDILNLNNQKITEARREIWIRCNRLIKQGDEAFIDYLKGSVSGTQRFKDIIEDMRDLIQSSAEYSATARACFKGSPHYWVRETVT